MRTYVYVDAFNLYYGCLKGTPYRWLNLEALCRRMLRPENDVQRIKYFTSRVSARPDPGQPTRQQAYLRALATLSCVEVQVLRWRSDSRCRSFAAAPFDFVQGRQDDSTLPPAHHPPSSLP
jgi:hypothetical protein